MHSKELLKYEGLVLPYSKPELLEFSIRKVRPKMVAMIVVQELVTVAAATINKLKEEMDFEEHYQIPTNNEDPTEAFIKFNECVEWMQRKMSFDKIIVDISGGLVPTRFGVNMGAISQNLPVFYQSQAFLGYEDDQLIFETEQQKTSVILLSNPLEKVGLLDVNNAVEMFNTRSYTAASIIFNQIYNRVERPLYRHVYLGMHYLAEGYKAWEELRYNKAIQLLGKARKSLVSDFFDSFTRNALVEVVQGIEHNISFLKSIKTDRITFPLILDCYLNARRRIEDERRYDDGVARLYRVTEMIVQYRLKMKSIVRHEVEWDKINSNIVEQFCDRKNIIPSALPKQISLYDGLILLDCYGDPVVQQILEQLESQLLQLLGARNKSVLAHGITPIRESVAGDFNELLAAILEIAFPGKIGDKTLMNSARHMTLDQEIFKKITLR